jgi:hypothetical protein
VNKSKGRLLVNGIQVAEFTGANVVDVRPYLTGVSVEINHRDPEDYIIRFCSCCGATQKPDCTFIEREDDEQV